MCHFQLTPLAVDAIDDSTINSGVFNVTKYEGIKPTTYAAPEAANNADPGGSGSLSTATSTGTPAPSQHASSSGLSTGAKAGIGVGVAVGVLFLVTAAIFLVVTARRKRRQAQPKATENLMTETETKPVVAPAAWIEGNAVQPGLTNVIKQEIDGEEIKLELDGGAMTTVAPPGELEGDSTRVTASNGPASKL